MHEYADEGEILRIQTPRAFGPLLGDERFKGASGGRSSAKSHFFAERLIEESLTEHIRAACVREVQMSLEQSVKQLLADKIAAWNLDNVFKITDREIRGPNDSLFIFRGLKSHTADTLKSLEGFNRGYVEEAQSLSQKSLDTLIPTFRENDAELWFAWNPNDPTDPIDKYFKENAGDPDHARIHVTYRDNPWLPEVTRRDIERMKRRDPEKYAHIYLGKYLTMSEARVFRNFEVREFETPADAVFYFGADWGYSIDPSVLVRCFIEGRTLYVDQEAYMVGCETDHLPFLFGGMDDRALRLKSPDVFVKLKKENCQWRGIPGAREWPVIADSSRPETISYMKKHGFPRMLPSIKGPGSVKQGVEFLQSYDIVVHPRCVHTADELTFYSYKTDPKTGLVIPILEDKKNHVIDSLRYSIERLRRKTKRAGAL